ncbi:ATP-binding protein [Paenibacillus sp. TAF58]
MNKIIQLPNGMEAYEAYYSEFPVEEYNCNPFIQALPPLIDKKTIIQKLKMNPSFKEEERELDSAYRIHIIQRLYKMFQVLPIHIDIWNMIFSLIYQGYLARNPFDKEYNKYINATGKQIINRTYDINNRIDFRTTASSGLLVGFSGMGKTTTMNRILRSIPQVIIHNTYNKQHFNHTQLAHLTLQTPHNSSLKALSLQFFMKIDELLGTNNYKKYVSRNLSVDAMLPLIGIVANNIGLGLLVIDEIQHIQNRGMHQMMNYFVTLMNSFGVPVVFIGTPASYAIFQTEFRLARRVTGSGEIVWNNLENKQEFRFFLESMWKFQWNRKFTPLTEELIQLFYEETQGVSDLIVKLFVNAQHLAIMSGKEELTTGIIKRTVKESFKLMKPMLDALRSGNPFKISQYEDLRKIEVTSITKKVELLDQQDKIIEQQKDVSQNQTKNIITTLPETKTKKVIDYLNNDIRSLFNQASKVEISPYELLLEGGYIDEMNDWQKEEDDL